MAFCVAAPAVPVAVNVFGPAVVPSVHEVTAAIPSAPVVTGVVGVTEPPPDATANVTATPATGFPFASCTITDGPTATAVPAVADWLFPPLSAIVLAAPVVPVAVNVTGLPVSVPEVAVSVFGPAVVPSVHEVTAAIPSAPVVTGVVGVTEPPPDATANVTATPATGFPFASCTITDGPTATAVPAVADWLFPPLSAIVLAAPVVPVAVNVTGLPVSVPEVAVSVFGPAVVPSVHEVTAAIPSAPVVTGVVGVTEPPPDATANVTATPATGFPFASCTITDGPTATAVPAVADWLFPPLSAIVLAAPVVPVAVNVTGLPVSVPEVAVSVFGPAVVPSVHEVTAAIPSAPVVTGVVGVTEPPPDATAKVTATPATG